MIAFTALSPGLEIKIFWCRAQLRDAAQGEIMMSIQAPGQADRPREAAVGRLVDLLHVAIQLLLPTRRGLSLKRRLDLLDDHMLRDIGLRRADIERHGARGADRPIGPHWRL